MMTFAIMYNPFSCVFYDERTAGRRYGGPHAENRPRLMPVVMAAPTMNDALYNNVLTASAIFLAMYGLFMV